MDSIRVELTDDQVIVLACLASHVASTMRRADPKARDLARFDLDQEAANLEALASHLRSALDATAPWQ